MTKAIRVREQLPSQLQLSIRLLLDSSKRILILLPIAILAVAANIYVNGRGARLLSSDFIVHGLPTLFIMLSIALCIVAYIRSLYLWNTTLYLRSDALYVLRNVPCFIMRGGYRVPYQYIQYILESNSKLSLYYSIEGKGAFGVDIFIKSDTEKSELKEFFNSKVRGLESIIIPKTTFVKPKHIRDRFKFIPKDESSLSALIRIKGL